MSPFRSLLDAYRWGRWPRRLIVAALLAAAAASALSAGAAQTTGPRLASRTVPVMLAGHLLPAGHVLRARDLRAARWPAGLLPTAATRAGDLVGRRVAAPVAAGEPVTPAHLVGPALADGLAAGQVAVPVTVGGGATDEFVHVGDRVDLWTTPLATGLEVSGAPAGDTASHRPLQVAQGVPVLAVLGPADPAPLDLSSGTQADAPLRLVVAIGRADVPRFESAQGDGLFAVVTPPP